ncbi:tRNA (adenosine(37)-N6)-threonylcarbamoyltransferase complex dimerization subunit type 1 TsaB [Maricaulis parjimensis]|uniref:tRNA (adenosine(37)-N6)-threonylcarbamoyltransferase complex dimerization subunit type 1 TsaB n=1 Tax=Maricaulis parjimensis TaxID=144023 RepID=UPI0019397DF1|nr:tRNA (adenosine(37)-N6)-threonylcarbamoyltransferase complex dimerization subunit type 1 TsaB [Maricaulis parjimensis]
MILLAIDTTGPDCSVALRQPGQADVLVCETIGRGHAERLAPMVQSLLAEAGLQPQQLDRIAVATGPGSFAGTRVATAFARGLALACEAQAVGISNLAVMAHQAGMETPLVVAHDAKRGEVVFQVWPGGGDAPSEPVRFSLPEARETLADLATGGGRLAGSASGLLAETGLTETGIETLDLVALLDCGALASADRDKPSPFYARPPDAKLPGGLETA